MDGKRLLVMYQMCMDNSAVMLQSLNDELKHKAHEHDNQHIDLTKYFLFLDEMKSFKRSNRVNSGTETAVAPAAARARSTACTLL